MSLKLKHLLDKGQKALGKKNYPSAGALFEEAVTLAPTAHTGWFGLGEVALGIDQADSAADFFGRAVELQPDNARYRQRWGETLSRLGEFKDALHQIQHAQRLAPRDAGILCSLSGIYVKLGLWQQAKKVLQEVVGLPKPLAGHYCLLGLACQQMGELDEALAAFIKATALAPRYPDAWLSLGHLYLHKQQLEQTQSSLAKLFELAPQVPTTLDLAGDLAMTLEDYREAANFFRQAADAAPEQQAIQAKLAMALVMCGDSLPAIDALERAYALGLPEDWVLEKLGSMFAIKYKTPIACENLEMAVARNPDNINAWNTLIVVYTRAGESQKVRKAVDTILQRDPNNASALLNFAGWYNDQGRHGEALELFNRVLALHPQKRAPYSQALWTMLSASSVSAADILALARRMDENCNLSLRRADDFADRNRDPGRRLKIGWVSSDIRRHPVSAFLPFMAHVDHEALETCIYYNFSEEDGITRQFRAYADKWREVIDIGDNTLADLIRGDEIDILVDLNGYTNGNRAEVFAMKPAPVQVTWLGFPGTSGMNAMDYIFIPPDPVLEKGGWCSETPWPLPDCYGVRANISKVAVQPGLPCERLRRPFTFACLNNFRKVGQLTIELWSRILLRLPEARLILVAVGGKDDETMRYFSSQFERYGVAPGQLEFRGYAPPDQYFDSHNEVDLGLDPFPFNGGTTGYDSIWMGVPFVTWPGEHLSARMGRAILQNVGLHELIADSADAYVDIAVNLAHDRERLGALRAGLRERMLASPLLDAPRMAKGLEAAFRKMWQRWCHETNNTTKTL
ncbi:MAG: tetratricopeptide repeat protein [Azoarcus sp.]|nr:tetratricopeptide repeat protein [Azoarcus sp.]